MKLTAEIYLKFKALEARIKELEIICTIKGSKSVEFTEMITLTYKLNDITVPKKYSANTNTHQLI